MDWIRSTLKAAKAGDFSARVKLGAVLALALITAAFAFASSGSAAPISSVPMGHSPHATSATSKVDSSFWVHIVGEVMAPGVYSLPAGSRLYELVALSGGFTKNADQSSVNLARAITDGEQVRVSAKNQQAEAPASNMISLNSASAATLETLPGVGPKLAARMVDWRSANSGFKTVRDLLKVGGIGDKLFAQIKDLVTI